jgi:hypothetical protein
MSVLIFLICNERKGVNDLKLQAHSFLSQLFSSLLQALFLATSASQHALPNMLTSFVISVIFERRRPT